MRHTEEQSDTSSSSGPQLPSHASGPGVGSDILSSGPVISLPSACSTTEGTSGSQSTRSSRSSGHSRHSSRHHGHRRRRRFRFKQKERNFLAAVCSMIVIVTLCTALAEPSWFYIRGGGCRDGQNSPKHSLGVFQYFYLGDFADDPQSVAMKDKSMPPKFVYHHGASPSDILVDCVSPKIVQVMRSIIALCFIGIAFSLMAFFLDLAGPSTRILKFLRRNAVFNIFAVLVCVTINGFSFMVTQLLDTLQNITKTHRYSKVEIRFDVSFYLVAGAGGMSVIAAACNLLRRYPPHVRERDEDQRENLLEDYDGMDASHSYGPDFYSPMTFLPPPPPYTP